MRILIVEDDIQIADMLTEALTRRQHVVDIAQDGEAAWDCIKVFDYNLVVLDITLPKLDGISFCRQMRDRGLMVPVLMLTARDTVTDKITGLDAGADDYVVKPFDLQELMARVRALLRRGRVDASSSRYWGDLRIDPSTYEVKYGQIPIHLTPKEFSLLELLILNGRRVMSRPGIIERIWSLDAPPTEEAVKTHIRTLRQKLKAAGAPDDFIETVHGLGYRLKQI